MSFVLSVALVRFAKRTGFVQSANERSSHVGERPTGGGLGILVAAGLAGAMIFIPENPVLLVPVVLALMLGLVGLWEDRFGLRKSVRFLAQSIVVAALLFHLNLYGLSASLGQFGPAWILLPFVAVAGIFWINLFNFMDGIDGMATSQALFVLISMLLLSGQTSIAELSGIWLWLAAIAAAALAFLFFNWSPAKIFVGDTGAYFFAFIIIVATLFGMISRQLSPFSSFILVGLFVTDALVTLARRVFEGQSWTNPHRTHAYQNLSRKYSHAKTTGLYMLINIFWLLPLAACAQLSLLNPVICVAIAYVALLAFVLWGKAGHREKNQTLHV